METLNKVLTQLKRERHNLSSTKEECPNIALVEDEYLLNSIILGQYELVNKITYVYVMNNYILVITNEITKPIEQKFLGKKRVNDKKFSVEKVNDNMFLFTTLSIKQVLITLKSIAYIEKIINNFMIQYSTYMQRFSNIVIVDKKINKEIIKKSIRVDGWKLTHIIHQNILETNLYNLKTYNNE